MAIEQIKSIPRLVRENPIEAAAVIIPLVVPLVFPSKYLMHILTLTWIMAIGSLGWNILYGYGGLINFGHTVFFGTAAYITAWLYIWFDISPWLGLFVSSFIVAVAGVVIAFVTSRSKGVYFALATSAIPPIVSVLFTINYSVTGGSLGLSIPWRGVLPWAMQFRFARPYYYIAYIFLVLICTGMYFITQSKLGFYLRAMGADEDAAQSLGIDVFKVRLVAMFISAFIGGISGAIFINFSNFIDPYEAFGWTTMINFLLYTILGGAGTIIGPVVGALIVIPLSEFFKLLLEEYFRGVHYILSGAVMMVVILVMPKGIYPVVKSYLKRRKS